MKALVQELRTAPPYLDGQEVATIYFGGGTPSLLSLEDCRLLLDTIRHHYPVTGDAEVTLEANPDDITREKLGGWREAGVNRLSIGIQSFFEEELRWMNRAHNVEQAHRCIEWSLAEGFPNFSIDLIYGSPLLTDEMWQQNVEMAIRYGVPHLSCYALTVEEKTPLHKQISTAKTPDVDSDRQARQFLLLMDWLRQAGYEHYEVSNFALPGKRSRHNSAYWKGTHYLGVGPSAHSFNGVERRWNIAHNNRYIQLLSSGQPAWEAEVLTPEQKLNEYLMISLRTSEGIDLTQVEQQWGTAQRQVVEQGASKFLQRGQVRKADNYIQLTDEGMLYADGIAAELFA